MDEFIGFCVPFSLLTDATFPGQVPSRLLPGSRSNQERGALLFHLRSPPYGFLMSVANGIRFTRRD